VSAGRLRKALAKKRVREEVYRFAIADDTAARKKLDEANKAKLLAGIGKNTEDELSRKFEAEVDAAQAELDACYEPIVFRGISDKAFEALVAEHPPVGDDKEKAAWNVETFRPALIAACAVDADLTAEEWAEELASERWTKADLNEIFSAAVRANTRTVSEGLPKG